MPTAKDTFPLAFLSVVILLASLVADPAVAQRNFDNGLPVTPMTGFNTSIGSDDNFPLHIADDFVLPASAPTISMVEWFGLQGNMLGDPIPPREFNIEIYGPGPIPWEPHAFPIYTFTNVTPRVTVARKAFRPRMVGPFVVNRYRFNLPSTISLSAGTTYWISIYAAADPSAPAPEWFYWCHSTYVGGNTRMRVPPYLPYFVPTVTYLSFHQGDVSFRLYR